MPKANKRERNNPELEPLQDAKARLNSVVHNLSWLAGFFEDRDLVKQSDALDRAADKVEPVRDWIEQL